VPPTPRSGSTPSSEETTTLLSAPAPASSFEVETEDRLARLEREFSLLRSRVESLESQNRLLEASRTNTTTSSDRPVPANLAPKQWRLVVLWLLGMSLLAAYGLLK